DIHMIGFQADIAGNGKAACGAGHVLGRYACGDGGAKPSASEHRQRTKTPQRHQPVSRPDRPNSDIVELKQRNPRLDPLIPCPGHPRLASPSGLPEFLSWPGLLLERTECQGPKRAQNPLAAPFSGCNGNPRKRRDRAATAVSNTRVNEV